MLAQIESKPQTVTCLAALTCTALLLVGCVPLSIPKSLDGAGKRVAVISLVSEDVRVTRTGPLTSEVVYLDMGGQIRKTIEGVFASQIATTHPTWVVESVNYDRDVRYGQLRGAAMTRTFTLSSYEEKIRAEVSDVMRTRKLDAVLLVVETAYEGLETRYPGIGVALVGVPGIPASASTVSHAEAHCTLLVLVVDGQGNILARGDSSGMYGPKTFDKNRGRFSYNIAENLEPPRVDFLRAGVVYVLTDNLKRQFERLGI